MAATDANIDWHYRGKGAEILLSAPFRNLDGGVGLLDGDSAVDSKDLAGNVRRFIAG